MPGDDDLITIGEGIPRDKHDAQPGNPEELERIVLPNQKTVFGGVDPEIEERTAAPVSNEGLSPASPHSNPLRCGEWPSGLLPVRGEVPPLHPHSEKGAENPGAHEE